MVKLQTPFGTFYLFEPGDKFGDRLLGVGPPYVGQAKYKTPTRPVHPLQGQKFYISDDVDTMRALVGDAYVPDKPFKKAKRKPKDQDDDDE